MKKTLITTIAISSLLLPQGIVHAEETQSGTNEIKIEQNTESKVDEIKGEQKNESEGKEEKKDEKKEEKTKQQQLEDVITQLKHSQQALALQIKDLEEKGAKTQRINVQSQYDACQIKIDRAEKELKAENDRIEAERKAEQQAKERQRATTAQAQPQPQTQASTAAVSVTQSKPTPRTNNVASIVNSNDLSLQNKIEAVAKTQLGVPYVFGGNTPGVALDCSSFVQYVMRSCGISVPRVAQAQWNASQRINAASVQKGDLIFLHSTYATSDYITHVGICLGDGTYIEQGGANVHITPINSSYTQAHLAGFGRVTP